MSPLPLSPVSHDPSKYILVRDAAERAGLTPARIHQLIKMGRLKAINTGVKKTQVLISSLDEFIATRTSKTSAPGSAPAEVGDTSPAPRKPRNPSPGKRRRRYFGNIRKLPNGTWQARYTGPDKKLHNGPKPFLTERDADIWLSSVLTAITTGKWRAPLDIAGYYNRPSDAPIFGEYAARWIREQKNRDGQPLAATTIAGYKSLLRLHLAQFAELPVDTLTRPMVRTWHSDLVETGKITTAAKAYQLLHAIYETLVDDGLIASTPVKVKGAANATTGVEVAPPTDDELNIIVNAINPAYRVMLLISAWGALRSGEVRELRRKDVHVIDDSIAGSRIVLRIKRAVSYTAEHGYVVKPPKNKSSMRDVELPPRLTPLALEHLEESVHADPEALLFHAVNSRTRHLGHATFWRHWERAREAAGRPDLHLHALRHWGATAYSKAGATMRETQARLGHSTLSAAMRYQHSGSRDAELARRLGDLGGLTGHAD